jgi:hypothetical protein
MPRRLRSLKEDPMVRVLDETPDLMTALERLHERLET